MNLFITPAVRDAKSRIALVRCVAPCIVVAAMCTSSAQAQLVVADCDSGRIVRTEEFAGAALAGHINGGAELYREYGFKHLTVHYVQLHSGHAGNQPSDEEELVVESYQMQSPLAAYGIYSISRHECGERDTAFTYSCSGPYQIQCAADSWYVRILNGTGSARAQAISRTLLQSVVRRTGQPRIPLPGLFLAPALDGTRDRVLLMTGMLGVQNGMPDWGDFLDGLRRFALYAVRLNEERGTIAELHLADKEDAALVAERIGVPSGNRTVGQMTGGLKGFAVWHSPLTLRILETTTPPSVHEELLDALVRDPEERD